MADPVIMDTDAAFRKLGTHGKPVLITLVPTSAVVVAALSGKLLTAEATIERHVLRYAFMTFDRIRTGELPRWPCGLCAKSHRGLRKLRQLAVIEAAIGAGEPSKPAIVVLICTRCDHGDDDDLGRRIQAHYGLAPLQEGHV